MTRPGKVIAYVRMSLQMLMELSTCTCRSIAIVVYSVDLRLRIGIVAVANIRGPPLFEEIRYLLLTYDHNPLDPAVLNRAASVILAS